MGPHDEQGTNSFFSIRTMDSHKLASIRIWPAVGHCKYASTNEAQLWCNLILELVARSVSGQYRCIRLQSSRVAHLVSIYARPPSSSASRVPSLYHKVGYSEENKVRMQHLFVSPLHVHSVERRAVVVAFARELREVLARHWSMVPVQLQRN
jgi:hypothetical protein